jgi:hypothetical protein
MSEGQSTFILLEAGGRCPPEDCGGAPGYERLLEILADPDDEEHGDMIAWCGGPFDPTLASESPRARKTAIMITGHHGPINLKS